MNKYMFEIKNKSIDISIIVTIVETTKRQNKKDYLQF